jgi:hypothetical protein
MNIADRALCSSRQLDCDSSLSPLRLQNIKVIGAGLCRHSGRVFHTGICG